MFLALFLVGTALGSTAEAQQSPDAERAVVKGISISPVNGETRVRLESDSSLDYTLTTAESPDRAVVQLRSVTFRDQPPLVEVGDGVVDRVAVQALPGGGGSVTLILAGPAAARAEQTASGLDVFVKVAAPTAAVTALARPQKLVTLLPDDRGVAVYLGSEPTNLAAFVLSEGRSLVVDAEAVSIPSGPVTEEFAAGPVAMVRMGQQDNRVRTVVEARAAGAFDGYRVDKSETGFTVFLRSARATVVVAAAAEPGKALASDQPLTGGGKVEEFGFRQDAQHSFVEFTLSIPAQHQVVETAADRVVVDLLGTSLPTRFQKALDTSAFPGPVAMVAAYPSAGNTRVVVTLRRPTPYRVEREGAEFTLSFAGGAGSVSQAEELPPSQEEIVIIGTGGAADSAPEKVPTAGAAGSQRVYTGQRLSMDFVNADIRNVLRLIGDVSGLNVVAGDDVQGKLTVRLVDVPWDQALEVILKTRGLGQVREGNIVRIAPAERLASEEARNLERAKAAEDLVPLITDIIPVSYASAQEISPQVSSVLSERGSVSVDARTNALLVKDVPENLVVARKLVADLDTPTPQVLIEARIVEVGSTFARDLGVQWGGQYTADTAHGNATGWAFPNTIGVRGATGVNDFAVNFPSTGGAGGTGAALAMTLGSIDDILTLDLRLSAIESSGKGRVISSPRVTTLDNRTAEISQGIEIPFTTATETQIETQSIDYKLVLNVTPHVTADRSIIMNITVTKDAPSTTYSAVDTRTPAKETRQAVTEVLVRDGETAVIGGIITDTEANADSGVPFLADIPGLGWLFKRTNRQVDKTEMIIFITPKIVNSDPLARNP
jgi:type IV pilus assembly protein PilQ